MVDDQPRYELRSSPMKASHVPCSPNRLEQASTFSTLPIVRDDSVDRAPSTPASRKLSFGESKAFVTSSANLVGSGLSTSSIGLRSLRTNATFFSLSTSNFIPRVRSSTCLPVIPRVIRERTASDPSDKTPVTQSVNSSESKPLLKPLSTTADSEDILFAQSLLPIPHPPRRSHFILAPVKGGEPSTLQPAEGGLSRSFATTRLQPVTKVLIEELQKVDSLANTSVDKSEQGLDKWSVPPLVPLRRGITSSTSFAYLKQEENSSRPTTAVRVRPPSPSRITKIKSGLLRSYSSVVIGATPACDPYSHINPVDPSRLPSPRKRSSNHSTTRKEEDTVVTTKTIVIGQKEDQAGTLTSRQNNVRLTPSTSTSSLRKRPSLPRLARCSSSTILPIDSRVAEQSGRKDTIVPAPEGIIIDCGPPKSPFSGLKRKRMKSGADIENTLESLMKTDCPSTASSTTPANMTPTTPFFLFDGIRDQATTAGENEADSRISNGTHDTTPKPSRRSKKMRRLEMDSGEVDAEARELALENATKSRVGRSRARDSLCAFEEARAVMDNDTGTTEGGVDHSSVAVVTTIKLPPAPDRSSLKKNGQEKSSRKVHFAHASVFLFRREQGYLSVPSTGEVCLGMEARHHDEEFHRLDGQDEEEGTMEMEIGGVMKLPIRARMPVQSSPRILPLGEKSTARHIEPLTSKQRSKILKTNGVEIDRIVRPEHESIRQRRRECGCNCEGGRCLPETCECSRNGIACQVDTDDGPFPCRCSADSCQNEHGRVEFNLLHVYSHYQTTFARLRMCERKGNAELGSPSLIRFPDDDDDRPRHNATSYLCTPPPAIYQVSSPLAQQHTHPCTPPMQWQAVGNDAGMDGVSNTRYPVTPVYKKFTGDGGGGGGREVPLSRVAFLKSAALISSNQDRLTNAIDNLDESMDNYATPPESNSPAL